MRDCSWVSSVFEQIKSSDFQCQSDRDIRYNCIAWAAGRTDKFWWPLDERGYWWPEGLRKEGIGEETVENFIEAFATQGYKVCRNGRLSRRYEKIVLYVNSNGNPTHAARLLQNGIWSSKLGEDEDIEHKNLECLEGRGYGKAHTFLKRRYRRCPKRGVLKIFSSFLSRILREQPRESYLIPSGTQTAS